MFLNSLITMYFTKGRVIFSISLSLFGIRHRCRADGLNPLFWHGTHLENTLGKEIYSQVYCIIKNTLRSNSLTLYDLNKTLYSLPSIPKLSLSVTSLIMVKIWGLPFWISFLCSIGTVHGSHTDVFSSFTEPPITVMLPILLRFLPLFL